MKNMEVLRCGLAVITCLAQAAPLTTNAQSTLYLSHLGDNGDTGIGVFSDQSWAVSFETGTSPNGYSLDSMQLRIAGIAGNPTGFALSVYGNNGGLPGTSIALLDGSQPTGAGIYAFAASDVTLLPSTVYWAVATSSDSLTGRDSFYWAFDPSSYTSSGGWSLGRDADVLNLGTWSPNGTSPLTLAIDSTAVPEPEVYALIGLGLCAMLWQRTKRYEPLRRILLNHSSEPPPIEAASPHSRFISQFRRCSSSRR
jgi:hypothetical protein